MLLVEVEGESRNSVRQHLAQISESVQQTHHLAFASRMALEQAEIEQAWSITRNVIPTLYRLKFNPSHPIHRRYCFTSGSTSLRLASDSPHLQKHETTASLFGHLGHGVIHIRPFLNVDNKGDVRKLHALANDIYEPARLSPAERSVVSTAAV